MKAVRKGFTLLELLVVIGVMGLMGSMAMVGGQEATNAARATNIADGLEKAATAMMMYYSDNAEDINENGTTAAKIIAGANAYLKTQLAATDAANKKGKYSVALSAESTAGAQWFVTYTFLDTDTSLKAMLANKAVRMQLNASSTAVEDDAETDDDESINPYVDGDTVYMLVR